jgi:pimeloyl-ACP methyl ester carboxylesterase
LRHPVPEKLPVSSGDVNLYAESWGSGDPVVVLCHGFGGSARNFRPQARAFSSSCRVVLYDARGHARSDAPPAPEAYDPERLVDDLERVLDVAGVERAVLGGLSMGTGVALRFALRRPERVRGLLCSAFPRPRTTPGQVEWALGFAEAIESEGLDAAGAKFAWGERFQRDPKGAELIRTGFLEHDPQALAHVLRRLLAVQPSPRELAAELGVLQMPVSIVVGGADAGSLEPSRELALLISAASLVEIPSGGHVVNLTNPAEFNAALRDLLARV